MNFELLIVNCQLSSANARGYTQIIIWRQPLIINAKATQKLISAKGYPLPLAEKKDWAQLTLCPTTGIAIIGITLPVLPQLREPRLQELQQPEQLLHSS